LQQLLASHEDSAALSGEEAAMKQSALLNLDVLASSFGHMRQFQAEFVQLLPTILQLALSTPAHTSTSARASCIRALGWQHVSTSSLLCLATLISSFQTKAHVLLLEFIPTLVPNTLALLQQLNEDTHEDEDEAKADAQAVSQKNRKRRHDEADSDHKPDSSASDTRAVSSVRSLDSLLAPLLHLAALSVLHACIVSVPELLSPYLAALLRVLLSPAYHSGTGALTSAAALLAASNGVPNASAVAGAANAAAASSTASPVATSDGSIVGAVASVDHASVSSVVSQSLASLISKVPSRTLLPYLFNHYKTAAAEGYASLQRLFQLLALVVAGLQADAVKQHFKLIFKFFLSAAQQLRTHTINAVVASEGTTARWPSSDSVDGSGCSLAQAEDALIAAFLELTMKLNETSFKGLFLKLLQWVGPIPGAAEESGNHAAVAVAAADTDATFSSSLRGRAQFLSRSLVLFKLIHQLTGKLKGIFVSYFGYMLDHCVAFLTPHTRSKSARRTNEQEEEEEEDEAEEDAEGDATEEARRIKRRKSSAGSASSSSFVPVGASSSSSSVSLLCPPELVDLVLLSLRNCFLYDTHHFLDKYHFQLLTQPMVSQLQYAFDTRRTDTNNGAHTRNEAHKAYDHFITHVITPTIVQMAKRMGNYVRTHAWHSSSTPSSTPPMRRVDCSLLLTVVSLRSVASVCLCQLQWKPLVSALLLHGRSSSSSVRRASAYVLTGLLTGVGDNMLVVLPELLPWISEMLEDAEVGVERQVHTLVKTIEQLSGESLDETLNGQHE
jgi:hypothetical protein